MTTAESLADIEKFIHLKSYQTIFASPLEDGDLRSPEPFKSRIFASAASSAGFLRLYAICVLIYPQIYKDFMNEALLM